MDDFKAYMSRVDTYLIHLCGLASDDLPDCMYRDWYIDGVTPHHAAEQCLIDAGYGDMLNMPEGSL